MDKRNSESESQNVAQNQLKTIVNTATIVNKISELSPVQMMWCLPDVFRNYTFVSDSCRQVALGEQEAAFDK